MVVCRKYLGFYLLLLRLYDNACCYLQVTTIACTSDPPIMVSDSRITDSDGLIDDTAIKIFRIKSNLIGVSGDYSVSLKIIRYLKEGGDQPEIKSNDIELMMLHKSGDIYTCTHELEWVRTRMPYYAIGSGKLAVMGIFAYCQMLNLEVSAYDAVKAAAKVSDGTGGKIVRRYFRR